MLCTGACPSLHGAGSRIRKKRKDRAPISPPPAGYCQQPSLQASWRLFDQRAEHQGLYLYLETQPGWLDGQLTPRTAELCMPRKGTAVSAPSGLTQLCGFFFVVYKPPPGDAQGQWRSCELWLYPSKVCSKRNHHSGEAAGGF